MKDIIVGIGNPIVRDDGIGIYIAEKLRNELTEAEVTKVSYSGLYLIDVIADYDRAILIDSIRTEKSDLGEVVVYQLEDFKKTTPFSIHSTDLLSAIEMSESFGIKIPQKLYFVTIEIKDNFTFSEDFTPEIEALKGEIYDKVKKEIFSILN